MRKMTDIYWTAGFIEGEGYFSLPNGYPIIGAYQKQREPLERLQYLFGGSLRIRDKSGHAQTPIWVWTLCGPGARALSMTLYPLMSPRRQERIRECLLHVPRGSWTSDIFAVKEVVPV